MTLAPALKNLFFGHTLLESRLPFYFHNCIYLFQIIFYMITLALVTPLGVIIGMIVTEYVNSDSGLQTLVIGLLQGLAGGTLLYITFYEVLDKEKLAKLGMNGLQGCLLLILGFSLMAGLEALGK